MSRGNLSDELIRMEEELQAARAAYYEIRAQGKDLFLCDGERMVCLSDHFRVCLNPQLGYLQLDEQDYQDLSNVLTDFYIRRLKSGESGIYPLTSTQLLNSFTPANINQVLQGKAPEVRHLESDID